MALTLKIVTPERVEYDGEAVSVLVPGTMGSFEILNDHAPIISSLQPGLVEYAVPGEAAKRQLTVAGGFVEVQKNQVSLCVEVSPEA